MAFWNNNQKSETINNSGLNEALKIVNKATSDTIIKYGYKAGYNAFSRALIYKDYDGFSRQNVIVNGELKKIRTIAQVNIESLGNIINTNGNVLSLLEDDGSKYMPIVNNYLGELEVPTISVVDERLYKLKATISFFKKVYPDLDINEYLEARLNGNKDLPPDYGMEEVLLANIPYEDIPFILQLTGNNLDLINDSDNNKNFNLDNRLRQYYKNKFDNRPITLTTERKQELEKMIKSSFSTEDPYALGDIIVGRTCDLKDELICTTEEYSNGPLSLLINAQELKLLMHQSDLNHSVDGFKQLISQTKYPEYLNPNQR